MGRFLLYSAIQSIRLNQSLSSPGSYSFVSFLMLWSALAVVATAHDTDSVGAVADVNSFDGSRFCRDDDDDNADLDDAGECAVYFGDDDDFEDGDVSGNDGDDDDDCVSDLHR